MSQYHQDLAREGRKVHNVPELTITHLDANQPEVFVNIVWNEMHLLEPVLLWVLLSWPALVQFIQGEWVQFWPLPLSERGRALKILLSKRLLPNLACTVATCNQIPQSWPTSQPTSQPTSHPTSQLLLKLILETNWKLFQSQTTNNFKTISKSQIFLTNTSKSTSQST